MQDQTGNSTMVHIKWWQFAFTRVVVQSAAQHNLCFVTLSIDSDLWYFGDFVVHEVTMDFLVAMIRSGDHEIVHYQRVKLNMFNFISSEYF